MRIAWFTHRFHPCVGGAENYGREMVRRFVRAGHAVDVLTSDALDLWYFTNKRRQRVPGPLESEVDGARVRRFPVRHLPLQRYVGRLLSYAPHWPTQCRVASYMPILPGIDRVRGEYDAVFAVGFPYTVFSYAALQTARAAGAPLLLTPFLHLATPGDRVHWHYTRPHQRRLLAESDTVILQTGLEARAVREWGIPAERILKLGMGVNHSLVTGGHRNLLRHRHGIPAGRQVFGTLGVCDPNKGTNDLVRAVAQLNAARSDDALIHLILGGASSPDFEAFAAELTPDTARWLTRLGPLAPDQVKHFFAAIDVFSLPSRTDSFGIVFLEAWANAKPVVAAAAGGVVDVIEHDRTGLLVPFGDVERLAEALRSILSDGELAHRLGEAGRAQVSQGYSWDDPFAILQEWTLKHAHRRATGRHDPTYSFLSEFPRNIACVDSRGGDAKSWLSRPSGDTITRSSNP